VNPATIICGSEGTLGIVTEAVLKLTPLPKFKGMLVVHFADVLDALAAVPCILDHRPAAVELLDRMVTQAARFDPVAMEASGVVDMRAPAMLFVEFFDDTPAAVGDRIARLERELSADGVGHDRRVVLDPGDQRAVWRMRERGLGTMEFEQIVNPRGGHHQSGGSPSYNQGAPLEMFKTHVDRMGAPPDAIERIMDSPFGFNVGRFTRYSEDWFAVFDSLGICIRSQNNRFYSADICARLFSTATGIEMDKQALMEAGERVWNLYKILNWREGFDRKKDVPPDKWFEPMKAAGGEFEIKDYFQTKTLTRADVEHLLDDYYDERGWDIVSGCPSRSKMRQLGLDYVISDLEKAGLL